MQAKRLLPVAATFASLLLLAASAFSQAPAELATPKKLSPEAAALVKESEKANQVMQHAAYLTNSIGSRLTGSQNLVRACEWAVKRFESFGLENVHLEEWGEVPVSFDRGPWFGAMTWKEGEKQHRVVLEFNTPAWSAGTKGLRRAKAFLQPKDEAELARIKEQLRGAWIVQPAAGGDRPGGRTGGRNRGKGKGDGQQGNREPRFDALRACEAAGALGAVGSSGSGYLRTGGSRNWRQISMDALPTFVRVSMVKNQHEQLTELLGKGVDVELEFNIQNRFREGPVKLYNVVADIPGTSKPDEFVLVGGHIDCWDGAVGAVDNASGCATAMEAARLIMASGLKPLRTIRFVFWSGEEQGLLGSAAYVKQHEDERAKISAYLNHDSGTNCISGVPCTAAMKKDLEKVFEGVDKINPDLPFALRDVEGLRGGGSDHSSFLAANIPAWSWPLKGKHNYGHIWHTQYDNYDQLIERYQKHTATVIAIGALGIANLDHLLSREKMRAPGGGRGRTMNLGITMDGTTVTKVESEGALAKAGFKQGDKILQAGENQVENQRDFLMTLFRAAGEPVEVTVLRQGKKVKLKVTLPMRRRRG